MSVIEEIAAERECQITHKHYSRQHDDSYNRGELAQAAAAYAYVSSAEYSCFLSLADLQYRFQQIIFKHAQGLWPWAPRVFKPTTPRRDLIKA
jgi:hypothetical protein